MGGRLPRDRFRSRRHAEDAAQSRALERLRYQRRVLGRVGAAQSGEEPRQPREAREVDGGRQDLIACRPHLPVGANRRRAKGARGPQGDGQGDPASVKFDGSFDCRASKSANGLHAKRGPMTGSALPRKRLSTHRSIVAKIFRTEKFLLNWMDLPPQIPLLPVTASIKPKYLPNRAGDCRFLD